jgi:hypothetical protein
MRSGDAPDGVRLWVVATNAPEPAAPAAVGKTLLEASNLMFCCIYA